MARFLGRVGLLLLAPAAVADTSWDTDRRRRKSPCRYEEIMRLSSVFAAAAFAALVSAPTPAMAQTPPSAKTFAAEAKALIGNYVRDGRFSGAVLVARDGQPILREGFGPADREWDAAVTPETEFRLGSITKQFTATAILQLVEQGKIGLDDPIGKYYAAAPKTWEKVTIRHLLTHRSGIPSYTDIPGFFGAPSKTDRTPDEIIALTREKPLNFVPGSKFEYDNTGYIILGWIIEKVSGQTYANYVSEHIFKPLGMNHSGYDVSAEILHYRASGYDRSPDGEVRNASYLDMTLPYAAGALYSNVDDLLIWDQALYAAKPLKRDSLVDMFADHGDNYGYGWFVAKVDGRRLWSHAGGINGFHTFLARYPDEKLTVVVLSNITQAPVEKIAGQLVRLNFGEPLEAAAKPGQVAHPGTEAALRRILGELAAGKVNYDEMSPSLAEIVRAHPEVTELFKRFGAVQSVTFAGFGDHDQDLFAVKFANATAQWRIALDGAGKIVALSFDSQ